MHGSAVSFAWFAQVFGINEMRRSVHPGFKLLFSTRRTVLSVPVGASRSMRLLVSLWSMPACACHYSYAARCKLLVWALPIFHSPCTVEQHFQTSAAHRPTSSKCCPGCTCARLRRTQVGRRPCYRFVAMHRAAVESCNLIPSPHIKPSFCSPNSTLPLCCIL